MNSKGCLIIILMAIAAIFPLAFFMRGQVFGGIMSMIAIVGLFSLPTIIKSSRAKSQLQKMADINKHPDRPANFFLETYRAENMSLQKAYELIPAVQANGLKLVKNLQPINRFATICEPSIGFECRIEEKDGGVTVFFTLMNRRHQGAQFCANEILTRLGL